MGTQVIDQAFLDDLAHKLSSNVKFKSHKIGGHQFNIISNATCSSLLKTVANNFDGNVDSNQQIGLNSPSDLTPGVYEGGFKVWECSRDMIKFIESDLKLTGPVNCLDLGCGSGIVGLCLLKFTDSHVDFQDFNSNVLKYYTLPNILLNLGENDKTINEKWNEICGRVNLISGDWSNFPKTKKYDKIFSCETIYNQNNYGKLTDILVDCLSSNGAAYFAAKSYYFGVGGGTQEFQDFIDAIPSHPLACDQAKVISDCVERNILKITHSNSTTVLPSD